jgi:hypothetical protein
MKWPTALLSLFALLGMAAIGAAQPVLSVDINERGNDPLTNTFAGFESLLIQSNISATAIQTNPTVRTFGSMTVTISGVASALSGDPGYDDRQRGTPVNSATIAQALLWRDFIFSRDTNSGGLDITIDGLVASQVYKVTIWSFDSGSTGNRVSDWSANGILQRDNYTFNGSNLPTNDLQYQFSFKVAATPAGQLLIQGRRDGPPAANNFAVFLNAFQIEPSVADPPVITTQPVGGTRGTGDRFTFRVAATGTQPLVYRWFKGGVEIPGATSPTYTLATLSAADTGTYTVEVSNSAGTVLSDPAILTFVPDPAPDVRSGLVSFWPMDLVDFDEFPVEMTPDRYSNNRMRLISASFTLFSSIPGQFDNAVQFNGVDQYGVRTGGFPIYNNSAYSVALWINAVGTGQSDRRFFSESSTNSDTPLFNLGSHTTGADGTVRVFIRDNANAVTLARNSTRAALDGTWHHVVWTETNGFGRLYIDGVLDETDFAYNRTPLTLNQTTLGAILRSTVGSYINCALDEVAVWSRPLTSTEVNEIRRNGVPPPIGLIPPAITQSPASQSVLTRSTATFSFAASGSSPLTVRWRKDNTVLPNETNTTLVLRNVTLGDAGGYDVIVSNPLGSATSLVATLTVTIRPPAPEELKIDFNNNGADDIAANTEPGFESFSLSAFGLGPFARSYGGIDVTLTGIGVNVESRRRLTPTASGAFTEEQLLRDFVFARDTTPDTGLDIAIEFLEPNTLYGISIWSFDTGSTALRTSDWTANGNLTVSAYAFDGGVLPVDNNTYRFGFNVTSDAEGKILIQGRRNATTAGTFNVFVNALALVRRQLRIASIDINSFGDVHLTVEILNPAAAHHVEQKVVLTDPWFPVPDGDLVIGGPAGNILELTFPAGGSQTRFYRVVEGQ